MCSHNCNTWESSEAKELLLPAITQHNLTPDLYVGMKGIGSFECASCLWCERTPIMTLLMWSISCCSSRRTAPRRYVFKCLLTKKELTRVYFAPSLLAYARVCVLLLAADVNHAMETGGAGASRHPPDRNVQVCFYDSDTRQILCINHRCTQGQRIPDQAANRNYLQRHQSQSARNPFFQWQQ